MQNGRRRRHLNRNWRCGLIYSISGGKEGRGRGGEGVKKSKISLLIFKNFCQRRICNLVVDRFRRCAAKHLHALRDTHEMSIEISLVQMAIKYLAGVQWRGAWPRDERRARGGPINRRCECACVCECVVAYVCVSISQCVRVLTLSFYVFKQSKGIHRLTSMPSRNP